ncbi:2-oxoglutarate dehydrogenase OS=Leifsonia shinshuensis OX=150026 GN=HNR13_000349 PE=4 SV=1 [Leifsonia shinshuensis]
MRRRMSASGFTLRGARLPAALIGAGVALVALLAGPAAAPATASPAGSIAVQPQRAAGEAAVTASLTTDNGGVLAPGQDLVASVTVTNSTGTAYEPGSVALWLDPKPHTSRSDLASWLTSSDTVSGRVDLGKATLQTLEPGASAVVRVTVPAAAIPFGARPTSAVYGIGATVEAGQADASARGSVVWNPGAPAARSDVGVVMPIVSPSTGNGLLSADELTTYTAANGVLTRDLDGVQNHATVAIGIDPMIIASIRALGNSAPPTATAWLDRLSSLPNDTFSLGYGDADVAGQLQAGLPAPLQPTALGYALDPKNFTPTPTSIGEPQTATATPAATPSPTPTPGTSPSLPTLDRLLAWKYSLSGVAWPGDDTVRTADLAPLAASGLGTVILSGSNTNADKLAATPNAPARNGSSTLAVSDQRLSDALRQAVSAPSDLAWNTAMSKLNAQLELISAEGTASHHVLLAMDRSWPSSGTQLQRTLDALFTSPWAAPSTFPALLKASQSPELSLTDSPESQTRIDSIHLLLQDEKSMDEFATILADPTTLTGQTRAQLLTLLAVSWQNPRTDWTAAVDASRQGTIRTLHAVHILPTENVNLVSAQGSIPFTVSNELTNEAVTVVLSASPSNSRLEIDAPTTKTIPQDSRATMLVPVKAKVGNGQVILSLQLYSPTGVPIGDPSSVTVDVHADWEGIGALIFGGLLVLLFGFGIVRNILRRRDQRKKGELRPEGEGPETDDAPTDTAPTDREAEAPTRPGGADG